MALDPPGMILFFGRTKRETGYADSIRAKTIRFSAGISTPRDGRTPGHRVSKARKGWTETSRFSLGRRVGSSPLDRTIADKRCFGCGTLDETGIDLFSPPAIY